MNRKIFIIIGVLFVLILLVIVIIKLIPERKKTNDDLIPVYDADVICSLSGVDTFEDEVQEYSIKAYLTLKDNFVTKAILVSASTDNGIAEARKYTDDFSEINGINAKVSFKGNMLVTEVEYDYETINLDEVRDKLGYLLLDDSIFNKTDTLPITLKEYQEWELKDYVCN